MLTKLQVGFCIAIFVGLAVFAAAIFTNKDVATMPGWLGPAAWGSFGLMVVGCLGVVVTIALDRERPAKSKDEPDSDDEEPAVEPPEAPIAADEGPEFEHDEPTQVEHGTEATLIYQPSGEAEHEAPSGEPEEPLFDADDSESFEIKTD